MLPIYFVANVKPPQNEGKGKEKNTFVFLMLVTQSRPQGPRGDCVGVVV